jgi:hypothetical protein
MRTILLVITAVACPLSGAAQTPAPPAAAQAGAAEARPPASAPAEPASKPSPLEPQGYAYEAGGRRDPFISLVRRGDDMSAIAASMRPAGLAGMATSEVALRGTIQGKTREWIAILQGVDGKNHLARAGDKLFDGTIRAVTADSMVILQQVNDPLSLQTQREVRKLLRQSEEAK